MTPLSPISFGHTPLPSLSGASAVSETGGDFSRALLDALGEANSLQQRADGLVEQLYTGGDVTPAEVLVSVQKADMAFRLLMQVRNKLVQAFQDVQNIRV